MSCSSAPKRSAVAARQLVGERLGEQRCDRSAVLGAEDRSRIAFERDRLSQHRERVLAHVEVVVVALLDAAERVQLRQDRCGRAGRVHRGDAGERVG